MNHSYLNDEIQNDEIQNDEIQNIEIQNIEIQNIEIMNYQYYRSIYFENTNQIELIGSQTIYSCELQDILIKTFCKDSFLRVYFQINQTILNPCYICPLIPRNLLIVSNEFYYQYFQSTMTPFQWNIVYNIPKVKSLQLTKKSGYFPNEQDSLNELLTHYLENNGVVNQGQIFTIDYLTNYITFEISDIKYINEIINSITDRLDEMNYTIDFNQHFLNNTSLNNTSLPLISYHNCPIQVYHYHWLQNRHSFSNLQGGDVTHQEVEIDFYDPIQSTIQPISIPIPTETPITNNLPPPRTLCETDESCSLSKEELRKKRLSYYE